MIYPADFPMVIEQQASFDREFNFTDEAGVPMDFTGYALAASLWTSRKEKLVDFTLTWIDQAAGKFSLTLTNVQTTALTQTAIWDLYVNNPDGTKDYYLRGEVIIEPGYTT